MLYQEMDVFTRRKKLQGNSVHSVFTWKKSHKAFQSIQQMTGIIVLLKRSVGIRLKDRLIKHFTNYQCLGYVFGFWG